MIQTIMTNDVPLTALDRQIFDATVPADHYLRRVHQAIDFGRIRTILLSSYHQTLGRPPFDPLVLLKLEFLQYQYDLSDREVINHSQVNMAFRLFLDLGLHSPLPDPSLLTYFRKRLGPEASAGLPGRSAPGATAGFGPGPPSAPGRDPRSGQHRGPHDFGPGGPSARPTPGCGLSLRPGASVSGRSRGHPPAHRYRRPAGRGALGAPCGALADFGGLGRGLLPPGEPAGHRSGPGSAAALGLDLAHKISASGQS